jgi:hypothetical protein
MSHLWIQLREPIRKLLLDAVRAHAGPPSAERERAAVQASVEFRRKAQRDLGFTAAQSREVQHWFLQSIKAKQPLPVHHLTCGQLLTEQPEKPKRPETPRTPEPVPVVPRKDRLPLSFIGPEDV